MKVGARFHDEKGTTIGPRRHWWEFGLQQRTVVITIAINENRARNMGTMLLLLLFIMRFTLNNHFPLQGCVPQMC